MEKNINSFSQNINRSVAQSANTISMLAALQKSLTSNDTFVTYDYEDKDGNLITYQLPSYESVINRLKALEESFNSIVNGKGVINVNDGSRRTISVSTIPQTPDTISGLSDPSTFTIDSNWFFEELMFPGAQVNIDLTGQIEDTADRVRVVRIILNADGDGTIASLWEDDLSVNNYDYVALITLLDSRGIAYYVDEETIDLPLVSNRVSGVFQITEDPTIVSGNIWYTLDNITYSTISTNGVDQGQNNILSVGDRLSYMDSIFEITGINQNSNKVRIKRVSGVQDPGVYSTLRYFEDPFRSKVVKVRFGYHEYDIIYFKGVSENYNLLADSWSTPVKFSSDELVLDSTEGSSGISFGDFYDRYVTDWGREWIAEAKDHAISAWFGNVPNAPVLNGDDFRVVQINTQINAAIDTTDVKNTAAEIESVKSQIASLKSTIAAQKTDLQSAANLYNYNSIQQQIATNTADLNNLQTTYSTLVDSFQTIVRENSAITTNPKYHIRGFFPIPVYKYRDKEQTIPEEIIGFEIAYRYIREDNTSTQLNTFIYTDTDGVSEVTGTFTDWIIQRGPIKTRVKDETLNKFVWKSENVADGTETNINQIDIAISKGEKVEIKARSISEAGYPRTPLMSEWSNSIIMEFPSTLATGNEIADLITMVNDDALNLSILNTMQSMGVDSHLDDTVPNTNSLTGVYYKHLAENIAFEESTTDDAGITTINSISLQKKIEDLIDIVRASKNQIDTNKENISSIVTEMTEKHALYEEQIEDLSIGVARLNVSVNTNTRRFDTFINSNGEIYSTKFILKNANGENAASISSMNQNDIFVLDATNKTDGLLGSIHAAKVYIHPDGATTGERKSLYDMIVAVTENASVNKSNIDSINSSVRDISTKMQTVATLDITNTLSARLDQHDITFDGLINPNGDLVSKRRLILADGVMNLAGETDGLKLFDGTGNGMLTGLHAYDVYAYESGGLNGTKISLNDTYSLANSTKSSLDILTRNYEVTKSKVDDIIPSNGNINATSIKTMTLDADTIIMPGNPIINGDVFRPIDESGSDLEAEFAEVRVDAGDNAYNVGAKLMEHDDSISNLDANYANLYEELHTNGSDDVISVRHLIVDQTFKTNTVLIQTTTDENANSVELVADVDNNPYAGSDTANKQIVCLDVMQQSGTGNALVRAYDFVLASHPEGSTTKTLGEINDWLFNTTYQKLNPTTGITLKSLNTTVEKLIHNTFDVIQSEFEVTAETLHLLDSGNTNKVVDITTRNNKVTVGDSSTTLEVPNIETNGGTIKCNTIECKNLKINVNDADSSLYNAASMFASIESLKEQIKILQNRIQDLEDHATFGTEP